MEHGGRIVSIGTALSRHAGGGPGSTLYAMSKSALAGLTKPLARELGPRSMHGQSGAARVRSTPTSTPADGPFASGERVRRRPWTGSAPRTKWLPSSPTWPVREAAYITGTEVVVDGGHAA